MPLPRSASEEMIYYDSLHVQGTIGITVDTKQMHIVQIDERYTRKEGCDDVASSVNSSCGVEAEEEESSLTDRGRQDEDTISKHDQQLG